MALIILSPNETNGIYGGFEADTVIGATGNETAFVDADGVVTFDSSWEGGDTINIAGDAGDYTVEIQQSDLIITNANGASISVPIKPDGATIKFADADGRQITIKDGDVCLGDQVIEGPAEAVDAGDGGGGGGGGGTEGDEFDFTVGPDDLTGTSGDDLFEAKVIQNPLGEQTNALGTGDEADGGAGNDKLDATVQDASPLNGGPGAAIRPETVDIEVAHFTAIPAYNLLTYDPSVNDFLGILASGFIESYGVEINAAEMIGLDEVGSVDSDDSLVIYNLTTLTDSGEYDDRRVTESVMVRMDHSGNGDAIHPESDLRVYFDQNYLFCDEDAPEGSILRIQLMDLDAAVDLPNEDGLDPGNTTADGDGINNLTGQPYAGPLDQHPITRIRFTLDGEVRELFIGSNYDTYSELLAAVQSALAAAGPDFANLTASFGPTFVASDTDDDPLIDGEAVGQEIIITNSGPEQFGLLDQVFDGETDANRDFHTQLFTAPPEQEDCKITVQIKLEKVGRGGDGGELIVGGMATDHTNSWFGGNGAVRGVEQFNITVLGDATQPSSLAALSSTNNALLCVIIEDEGDSDATLTIGNSQTEYDGFFPPCYGEDIPQGAEDALEGPFTLGGEDSYDCNPCDLSTEKNNALQDVLIFDASKFDNDTEVHGFFSVEVVPKYLDLSDDEPATGDDAPHATVDNLHGQAVYTFGEGDNLLNMNIDKTNMSVIGSATREDFSFTTYTNGGNDHVQIQIGDGEGTDYLGGEGFVVAQEWYHNHVLNNNLHIDTGDGHDKVEVWGSTAADIDLGDGNDVVFTDSSGGECGECLDESEGLLFHSGNATWIFNTRIDRGDLSVDSEGNVSSINHDEDDLANPASAAVGQANNVANIGLVVTYQGISSQAVEVGTSWGPNGDNINDLDINQAIKLAINSSQLSAVLKVYDGPGRTLVVESLLDAHHTDLEYVFDAEGHITGALAGDLYINLVSTGPVNANQAAAGASTLGDVGFDNACLASIGFLPDGSPLIVPTLDAEGEVEYQPRYDGDFADCDHELYGMDSYSVNNNNVEGGLGDDIIILSSNGVGDNGSEGEAAVGPDSDHDDFGDRQGQSVETLDLNGLFGDDVVFNFTAANGDAQVDEVQCIQIAEMLGTAPSSGTGTFQFDFAFDGNLDGNTDVTVSVTWNTSSDADSIAADLSAALNASGSFNSYATASVDPDDLDKVIITYDGPSVDDGANYPELDVVMISGFTTSPVNETQTITFTNDQPVAGSLEVDFGGVVYTISVGGADAVTPEEIADAFAALFDADGDVVASSAGGVLTLSAETGGALEGSDLMPAVLSITTSTQTVDWDVATTQDGGLVQDVTAVPDTVVDGSNPSPGWDIFDVDDIIGPVTFGTNFTNWIVDNAEAAVLTGAILAPDAYTSGARSIAIIDTLEGNDYAFDPGVTTEADRIANILNDADPAGGTTAMSLVITVDADNIGTFYKVTDGPAAGDVTVVRQGSIELARYVDIDKDPIGNWDQMSLANFVPLTPSELVDTFSV